VRKLFRGGTCTLQPDGVDLCSGNQVVFCPWSLFNTPGQPLPIEYQSIAKLDRCVLPINGAALHLVELRGGDHVVARGGEVNSRQFRFRSGAEAEIAMLYEVCAAPLGQLLLTLGRRLGRPVIPQLDESAEAVIEVEVVEDREAGGWATVPLTRVTFPPFCCDCGSPTSTRKPFAAFPPLFRLGRWTMTGANPVWVSIPYCARCQRGNRERYWRLFARGFFSGLALAVLATVAACALCGIRNPAGIIACGGLWMLAGLFLGYALGRHAGKRVATVVELKDYSPRCRTISMRFRWRTYADAVLTATHAHALPLAQTRRQA